LHAVLLSAALMFSLVGAEAIDWSGQVDGPYLRSRSRLGWTRLGSPGIFG
jgi:hypothetical protein